MGNEKSPWKERGIVIDTFLGVGKPVQKKKAFPNETFTSQEEYWDFCDKHKIYGVTAYLKKQKLQKQANLLVPKLRPPKEK